jgi:hypothetical protein
MNFFLNERKCTHIDNLNCSVRKCQFNFITFHDRLVLTLSFNVVITIELLLDLIKKEDLLINLRMQEENSRILGAFLEMKN